MLKYRMDIFKPGRKPGHPAPLLWRRRDIFASDDATAKAAAEDLYRAHAAQRILTNFYLCDSAGRSVYESVGTDPMMPDHPDRDDDDDLRRDHGRADVDVNQRRS